MILDRTGRIEYANPRLEQMFGYGSGELSNTPYSKLITERDQKRHDVFHKAYLGSPVRREMAKGLNIFGRRKDGSELPVDISLSPVAIHSNFFVTCIVRDISDQKELEREKNRILIREKELRVEAEKNNRIKDEFLATLSHELRTPLTTVLTWAQTLRLGTIDADRMNHGIEVIERNAKAQSQLIDDLLDVSRIQSGKLPLTRTEIDPTTPVRSAIETVQPFANTKGIKIDVQIPPVDARIFADATRLQQVFWNLLTNAIKFSPSGSEVKVTLSQEKTDRGEFVRVEVKDHGRGIKADFLPHVFERFTQADSSTTRTFGGLGLGMAIVHSLVKLHEGEITVESPGEGMGATFVVTLPVVKRAVAELGNAQGSLGILDPKPGRGEPANLAGVQILLVDDDDGAREAISVMLEAFGASVTSVKSAEDAVRSFEEKRPDILVSDIGMPDEDGYSLIGKIRRSKHHQGKTLPAIALSAYAGVEDIRRSIDAGFNRHVAKPLDAVSLSRTISEVYRTGKK